MTRELTFTIPESYEGKKVIQYLRGAAGFSARLVVLLKRTENGITLNGVHTRTIDRLKMGDTLRVCLPGRGGMPEPINMPLDILYEDADLLVINKAPNLAMHPTRNHQGDTLANAVAAYLLQQGSMEPLRAVGRLDKGTSGLVVCAKNAYAAAKLSGKIQKEYLAVAGGGFTGTGTIDAPIYRPDPMKTLRACGSAGEHAVTHWEALRFFSEQNCTLLRIHLETGRTHQIRVHFAHLSAPLLGDVMYGGHCPEIGRPLLHCTAGQLTHPVTGKLLELCAPAHADFDPFLQG